MIKRLFDNWARMLNYYRVFGFGGFAAAMKGKLTGKTQIFAFRRPGIRHPLYLRLPSTDLSIYEQIFIREEYKIDVSSAPKTMVDAGANIGFAAVYFANKYPEAKIVAIEPEDSNYTVMVKNVAPYPNIVPVRAALWHENKMIELVDPNRGKWGFVTQDAGQGDKLIGGVLHQVPAMTVDTIMRDHGMERLDILKIDIEGAELEVFQSRPSWVEKVDALIIELHEPTRHGCSRSFYNATNGFDGEWMQGENICLVRAGGCLKRPTK